MGSQTLTATDSANSLVMTGTTNVVARSFLSGFGPAFFGLLSFFGRF
jgi:hypothetical protein